MPRIYSSRSDPIDYCRRCFPSEAKGWGLWGDVGDGPDGRGNCYGYDAEHPAYSGEMYRCKRCRRLLTDEDN